MAYRLKQIARLVEEGVLPDWVTDELADKCDAIGEVLEYEATFTIRGPKGDGTVRITRR